MKAMVASVDPSRFLEMADQLREWSARIGSDAAVGAMVTYSEDVSAHWMAQRYCRHLRKAGMT